MALIEQQLANELVVLRYEMSQGTADVTPEDLEHALQRHLDDAQQARRILAETADNVRGLT